MQKIRPPASSTLHGVGFGQLETAQSLRFDILSTGLVKPFVQKLAAEIEVAPQALRVTADDIVLNMATEVALHNTIMALPPRKGEGWQNRFRNSIVPSALKPEEKRIYTQRTWPNWLDSR